jgi:iron complex outermembrane receptor protein
MFKGRISAKPAAKSPFEHRGKQMVILSTRRGRLFASAAGVLLVSLGASGAQAQPSQSPPASSDQASALEEVVVTARRRDEALQDVPVSVVAIGQEALQRASVRDSRDLTLLAPSLNTTSAASRGNVLNYELRGITATDTLLTQDPAVGIYLNEVVQTRPYGLNQQLYDMQSVQVLLGPQGTHFGRNTVGGAILYTTNRPTDEFSGEAAVTFGNYERNDYYGVLNVPLGNQLAVRLALKSVDRDGYTRELVRGRDLDNEHARMGRLSIKWDPSAEISNLLVLDAYWSRTNGNGTILHSVSNPALQPLLAAQQALGVREVRHNYPDLSIARVWGAANTTSWDISDNLTVKNIVGYRKIYARELVDLDGSPAAVLGTQQGADVKQISEELQFQGSIPDSGFEYIVGGYYFLEKGNDLNIQSAGPAIVQRNNSFSRSESKSLFLNGTYRPPGLSKLSLSLGYRYIWDERSVKIDSQLVSPANMCILFGNEPPTVRLNPCLASLSKKFESSAWSATLQYDWTDEVMTYAAHRHGYRSGGFNQRATRPAQYAPFRPEKVDDYEIGLKSQFEIADVPVRANIAVFHTKYDDVQRTVALQGVTPLATSILNAATAELDGYEATLLFRPIEGLTLSGYVSRVKGKFKEFATGSATFRNIPFPNAKTGYGASASYERSLDEWGDLHLSATYAHRSRARSGLNLPAYEVNDETPAYGRVNLSAALENIGGSGVSAEVYVRNLTNKTYVNGVLPVQSLIGVLNRIYGEPRMYGMTLSYKFGAR